jgi:hypothetical protein
MLEYALNAILGAKYVIMEIHLIALNAKMDTITSSILNVYKNVRLVTHKTNRLQDVIYIFQFVTMDIHLSINLQQLEIFMNVN